MSSGAPSSPEHGIRDAVGFPGSSYDEMPLPRGWMTSDICKSLNLLFDYMRQRRFSALTGENAWDADAGADATCQQ